MEALSGLWTEGSRSGGLFWGQLAGGPHPPQPAQASTLLLPALGPAGVGLPRGWADGQRTALRPCWAELAPVACFATQAWSSSCLSAARLRGPSQPLAWAGQPVPRGHPHGATKGSTQRARPGGGVFLAGLNCQALPLWHGCHLPPPPPASPQACPTPHSCRVTLRHPGVPSAVRADTQRTVGASMCCWTQRGACCQ